jgi:hypothetical protein
MGKLAVFAFILTTFAFLLPQKYLGLIEAPVSRLYPIQGFIWAGNYRKPEWKSFEGSYLRLDQKVFKNALDLSVGTRMVATEQIKIFNEDIFNGSVIATISEGECFIVNQKPKARHGIWNLFVAKTFCFAIPRF